MLYFKQHLLDLVHQCVSPIYKSSLVYIKQNLFIRMMHWDLASIPKAQYYIFCNCNSDTIIFRIHQDPYSLKINYNLFQFKPIKISIKSIFTPVSNRENSQFRTKQKRTYYLNYDTNGYQSINALSCDYTYLNTPTESAKYEDQ